ncbi:hypothetical protein [Hymenobacter sp. BRD67]|uniref:hypothetical protein n=1 Tax=Hymenobacter sp. BRD67 TaxID=2675877 RepID=UPI001564C7D4|nr:hypothetical protein [Hymenobacter sp. BRD67]QKG53929.1 hypothetical protein GKZ67_16615 [Hymenobacter sp. BRD67]
MKGEDQILGLLAELLRKPDQTHETLAEMNNRLGNVENRLGNVENKLDTVAANQVAHQQTLHTLALNQHQRELEDIMGILDSVARMQRDTNRRLDRLEHPGDFA